MDQVRDVLDALLEETKLERLAQYRLVAESPAFIQLETHINDHRPDRFRILRDQLFSRSVEGLLMSAGAGSDELKFLYMESKFVQNHVRALIERYEGGACVADKTRTILKALARFYADGQPIFFNYSGEFTYHLPDIILREQAEILRYFRALRSLHLGRSDRYIEFLHSIAQ